MKRFITCLLLVSLLLGAFACAKSSVPAPAPSTIIAPAPESSKGTIFAGISRSDEQSSPAPVITLPPVPTPTPAPTTNAADSGQSWAGERMIVRTGNIALVVVDIAKAIEQITQLAGSFEGFVVSSNSWKQGDVLAGSIAIRVSAKYFDNAIKALHGMAVDVTSESTSGQDVTEEYVDLSAKLHNLQASEAQLLTLMEKAGTVADILDVQRELTNTRGQIEQTKGRMQYLEQTSAMSLINVNLEQSELNVKFTARNNRVKTGQDVWFEASIAGGISPYNYEWDFGDGSTSTTDTPTHAYKSKGSYTVTLKVTDDKGNTDSQKRDNYITVLPGWSAGNVASSAWQGFLAFGRVVINIVIWLVIFIPLWIVIGVIVYFAWWRRRRKKA
jgi:hypothetical protein